MDSRIQYPINKIKPDPNQPRRIFDEAEIEDLAKSMEIEGMINGVEIDSQGMIITGERRWRAARLLKWETVPVTINKTVFTEYTRFRRQVIENIHQASKSSGGSMNPIDLAKAFAKLIKLKTGSDYVVGHTAHDGQIQQVFTELGISERTFYMRLNLLSEPDFVQEDILLGRPVMLYKMARRAPEELRSALKIKIARGDYTNNREVGEDALLLKQMPDLTPLILERKRAQENEGINRILNTIAKLALALEAMPFSEVNKTERGIVQSQLNWLLIQIEKYNE